LPVSLRVFFLFWGGGGLAKGEKEKSASFAKEKERKKVKKRRKNSPCDQHRQELVAELRVGHRQAGLGVPRLKHGVEEALVEGQFWLRRKAVSYRFPLFR
jgi:hypothetical protein